MGIEVKEAFAATAMELPIFCGGLSRVGINLAGAAWAGTVSFQASADGVNFGAVSVTPFASGTKVSSATANGNWFFDVKNYVVFKAVFTRTSGTLLVTLNAANDSSWQNAFLAANSRFLNSVATNATNTLTVAAQANRAWRLRSLVLSVLGGAVTWAAQPVVTIKDGSTLLWGFDLPTTNGAIYNIALPSDSNIPGVSGGGLVNTPGNTLVVAVAAGASGVQTNISAEVIPA